jgi:hypothetical protein
MALQRTPERFRDALAGKVILSWAEASHKDDNIGTRERNAGDTDQVASAIAHERFEIYFYAQLV